VTQGHRQGVPKDVSASGLLSSTAGHMHQQQPSWRLADDVTGWRAQSAVFLVHAESLRQAPGGFSDGNLPGVSL
jgi:hypothetical protein